MENKNIIKGIHEQQLQVISIFLNGNPDTSDLDYLPFIKVDNKKVHSFNFFPASVFLSTDDSKTVLIVGNYEKIIYYVGGEKESPSLKYEDVSLFESEQLYERFSDKVEDSEKVYYLVD